MIYAYPPDCTDFSTNGNGALSPISCEVTETLNGEYEVTLVHPIDEAGKWQRLVEGCILRVPVPIGMTPYVNGHVGYYVGNGYVIEWRGFNYGCVRTKLSGRKWTHWYRLPWIDYGEGALIKTYDLGERELRKGITGGDVKEMQTRLQELSYDLGKYGIDGDFESDTQAAVTKFQQDNGLEATGVYDAEIHGKVTGESVKEAVKIEEIEGPTVEIVTKNGGTVNVRVGNGTEYEIIKEVSTGEVLSYIATAGNGWNAVKVGTQVGWVSGEYSQRI